MRLCAYWLSSPPDHKLHEDRIASTAESPAPRTGPGTRQVLSSQCAKPRTVWPPFLFPSASPPLPSSSRNSFCLVLHGLRWPCLRAFAHPILPTWHFLPLNICRPALHLALWASAKMLPREKGLPYPSYLKHLFLAPNPGTSSTFPHLLFFFPPHLSIADILSFTSLFAAILSASTTSWPVWVTSVSPAPRTQGSNSTETCLYR